jgi:lipopolysaccharide assembly outer membrane protein LptD (OstA)
MIFQKQIKKIIFICSLFLSVAFIFGESRDEIVVTIERAKKTEYTKNAQGAEVIQFLGNVQISVKSKNTTTSIIAEIINFDRKNDMLYAEGSVSMSITESNGSTELLTAQSLFFNINTQEGVFDDGRVVQSKQSNSSAQKDSVLVVYSDLFGKTENNTITFKNGELTFCNDENPHWKIKASRIWLLPGNEFSFANAFLFIGPIPVLYLPFFYYPKDEMVFNPVIGYDSRKGYFFQSTTYLIGRKPLDTSKNEDGFNFMKSTQLKEQELQGLFLHNLEANAKMPKDSLKVVADFYSALGGMFGLIGSFKPDGIISSIEFDTRLGFSNTLFPASGKTGYITYSPSGIKYSDSGYFFGIQLPFRFASTFKTSGKVKGFQFSLSLPIYSDPFFTSDFNNRSENMDWISFLLERSDLEKNKSSTKTEISSFNWLFSGSYTPDIKRLSPFVSSASIRSFSSSIYFSSKSRSITSEILTYSPERTFFYISQIKPLDISFNLSGTLINYPKTIASSSNKTDVQFDLSIPELLEQDTPEKEDSIDKKSEEALPVTKNQNPNIRIFSPLTFKLTYSVKPDFASLITYSSKITNPDSFSFSDMIASYYKVKSPLDLTGDTTLFNSMISIKNQITVIPEYQKHPSLSDEYTSTQKTNISLNDLKAQKITIKNNNNITIKPFIFSSYFANTSIGWSGDFKLLRSDFTGTVDNPEWDFSPLQWNTDSISTHNVKMNLSTKIGVYSQEFSFEANLPPLIESYKGKAVFVYDKYSLSLSSAYKKKSLSSSDWYFSPLSQSFTAKVSSNISISESYTYDIEEKSSLTFSLKGTLYGVSILYTMRNTYPYRLTAGSGWQAESEKKFIPYSTSISYGLTGKKIESRDKKISFSPTFATSFAYDMIQPTNSYLTFTPSFTFLIKDNLELTFSSSSRNQVLFRYVQDLFNYDVVIPGEKNILIDLWNSFAFWDREKRISSGFKLKSLNITLKKDLHDWTLSSEFKIEPRLITSSTPYRYDFSPYFTLSVIWKPLKGMKTVIQDEYGEFTLNP